MSGQVKAGQAVQYAGVIVIEWPQPRPLEEGAAIPSWKVTVFDALSGKPITMRTGKIEIHAADQGIVTADLTMLTDPKGNPLFDESAVYPAEGGGFLQGTFTFLVSEMRVRQPAAPRAALEPKFVEPDVTEPAEP